MIQVSFGINGFGKSRIAEMYVKRGYKEKRTCRISADNGDILIYDEMEKWHVP